MKFSEEQLREKLSEEEYNVTQNKGTEKLLWLPLMELYYNELCHLEPFLVVIGISRMMGLSRVWCVERSCSSLVTLVNCYFMFMRILCNVEVILSLTLVQVN